MTSPAVNQKFPLAKQYLQFLNLFLVKQREYCCLHMYALLESVHYRHGHSIFTCNSFVVNLPHLSISVLVFYPLERYGTLKSYEPSFCEGNPQQHSRKALISISYFESFFCAAAMFVFVFKGLFRYGGLQRFGKNYLSAQTGVCYI